MGARPTSVTLQGIHSGAKGTRQTLQAMAGFVRSDMGKLSPIIREMAVRLTMGCPQKDLVSEVKCIHRFVRDQIRYVRDINGVETVHTPEKVLEYGAGDCDDKTVLTAALLESIGYRTRIVAFVVSILVVKYNIADPIWVFPLVLNPASLGIIFFFVIAPAIFLSVAILLYLFYKMLHKIEPKK